MSEKGARQDEYYKAQTNLRKAMKGREKKGIKEILENITRSRDKNELWNLRRRLMGKNNYEFATITEDGRRIEDSGAAKDHIAMYHENLQQAREADGGGQEWTKVIKEANKETEKVASATSVRPISRIEMKKADRG